MNGSHLKQPEKQLLHLLYDDADTNNAATELNLNLNVGFKGNPNIGSVVFNDIDHTSEFELFKNTFTEKIEFLLSVHYLVEQAQLVFLN